MLQQKERELLEIMIVEIQRQNVPIVALKHDGIITRNRFDKAKVSDAILKKTKIKMKIDSERIG